MSASSYTYIIDAGSTKTDVAIIKNQRVIYKSFKGYNPNSTNQDFLTELNQLVKQNDTVYFYGSGLASLQNQINVKKRIICNNVWLFSDTLAACRATLNSNKGITAILGTGAVVAFFDGKNIIETKGGYGYLIDDVGGGYELGKRILSKWLNNDLNQNAANEIKNFLNLTQNEFIYHVYHPVNLSLISQVCLKIPDLIQHDTTIEKVLINYFDEFVQKHLLILTKKHQISTINFVGSIAEKFKPYIQKALNKYNLSIGDVQQKPLLKLVEFHQV